MDDKDEKEKPHPIKQKKHMILNEEKGKSKGQGRVTTAQWRIPENHSNRGYGPFQVNIIEEYLYKNRELFRREAGNDLAKTLTYLIESKEETISFLS